MPATHADALAALEATVPARLFRFASILYADPELNASAAALAVGAEGQHGRLLRDRRTCQVLAALAGQAREDFAEERHKALYMLATLCAYDPAHAFNEFGQVRNIHEIPPECRAAIEAWEQRPDGTVKIRFVKRVECLRLLMAHYGDVDAGQISVGGNATVHFHGRGRLE